MKAGQDILSLNLSPLSLVAVLWVRGLKDVVGKVIRLVANLLEGLLVGLFLQLLQLLRGQVDQLQVVLDSRRCNRLGKWVSTSSDLPRDQNVGSLDLVLLCQFINQSQRSVAGSRRSQWAVCLRQNIDLLEISEQVRLRASERELDLV